MGIIATYDGKIFHNPSNKFCIVIVKTADTSVPAQARDKRRYGDHLIRFTAVGYEIPMTDDSIRYPLLCGNVITEVFRAGGDSGNRIYLAQ